MSSQITSPPHRRPLGQSSTANTPSRSFGKPIIAAPQLSQSQASEDSFSAYLNHASGSSSPSSQPRKHAHPAAAQPRSDDDEDGFTAWPAALKSNTHLLSSQETDSDIENAPPTTSQGTASHPPSRVVRQPRPILTSGISRSSMVPGGSSGANDADVTPTNTQGSRSTETSTAFRPSAAPSGAPTSSPIRRGAPADLPPLYDGPSESQNHLSQSALEPYNASSSGTLARTSTVDDVDASAPSGTQGTAEILGSSGTSVPRGFGVEDAEMDLGNEGFDDDEDDELQEELAYARRSQRDFDDGAMDEGDDVDDGTDVKAGEAADGSAAGDNGRKRRRRTNQAEANVLASVFEQTAFPDLDTRTKLAQRLNMTVRSVSIWFQNRRQAMKKRSSRYGGPEGVAGLRPSEYPHAAVTVKTEDAAVPGPGFAPAEASVQGSNNLAPSASPEESKAATATAADVVTSSSTVTTATRASAKSVSVGASGTRAMRLPSPRPEPAGQVKDLRDLITGRAFLDGACARAGLSRSISLSSFDSPSQRTFSRPPLRRKPSLNDVMHLQDERMQADMAGSHQAPLSLSISMSGRAAIGGVQGEKAEKEQPRSRATPMQAALASRLPPALAKALRKQGLIVDPKPSSSSATKDAPAESFVADVKPQAPLSRPRALSHIWERMVSSSSSSDGPPVVEKTDSRQRNGADADEEDEEKTLRLIATRRAAKAQAKAKAELLSSKVLAAEAAAAAAATSHGSRPIEKLVVAPSGRRFRLPTLDMAAGRDRACDASARVRTSSLKGSATDESDDDDIIGQDELGALLSRKRPRFGMDYDWGAITAQVQVRSEEQRARQALLAAAKAKARRAQNARAARRTLEAKRAHERMQQIEDEERERASAMPIAHQGTSSSLSSPPPPPASPLAFEQSQDHRRPSDQRFIDEAGRSIAEGLYDSRDSYASSVRDERFELPALPGMRSMLPMRTRSIPATASGNVPSNIGQRFSASSSRESGPPRLPSLAAVVDGASASATLARSGAPYRSLSHSSHAFERGVPLGVSSEAGDLVRQHAPTTSSSDDWARPSSFARAGGPPLRPRPHFNYAGASPSPRTLQSAASAFRRTVSEVHPHLHASGRGSLLSPGTGPSPSPSHRVGRGVLSANRVSPPQQQQVQQVPMSSSPVLVRGSKASTDVARGHDDSGFFGSDSEEGDENSSSSLVVKRAAAAAHGGKHHQVDTSSSSSPAKNTRSASGTSRRGLSQSPTKGHPDRQAAELLLGLGREG